MGRKTNAWLFPAKGRRTIPTSSKCVQSEEGKVYGWLCFALGPQWRSEHHEITGGKRFGNLNLGPGSSLSQRGLPGVVGGGVICLIRNHPSVELRLVLHLVLSCDLGGRQS